MYCCNLLLMVFSNFVDVYLKILESAVGPVRETIRKSNSNLTQRKIIIQVGLTILKLIYP